MTRLFQQLPRRGTIWSPSCSCVKATSVVFSPRNMPRPWPPCHNNSSFWSRDHRDIPIESSKMNSHPNPRLLIDANQIKWSKTHILFLDFDWCPIEVMLTLHFKWTTIESLGWIALPSHSSLMKCEAFYLRKGWVERCTSPLWSELRIVPMAHRVTHPLSLWGYEHSRVALSKDQACHTMSKMFLSASS